VINLMISFPGRT